MTARATIGPTLLLAAALCFAATAVSAPIGAKPALTRSVLVKPEQVTTELLSRENGDGLETVVLLLPETGAVKSLGSARDLITKANLKTGYWIEIGRSPALAREHPEWMASLQGHPEWRRRFPKAPIAKDGEVIKSFPWVPILYQEARDGHRARVRALLRGLPPPDVIYLNDLQGPPSACGCGNDLCRWTADYGPVRTATDAGPDAAARFVQAIREEAPGTEVVPVWTSECEESEGGKSGHCAGVACFPGRCWRDFTQQLMPLAKTSPRIGVLATAQALGKRSEWIDEALRSFQKMPPIRGGEAVAMERLEPVLQAWKASAQERKKLRNRLQALGVRRCVEALTPIDQSWSPQLYRLPEEPKR